MQYFFLKEKKYLTFFSLNWKTLLCYPVVHLLSNRMNFFLIFDFRLNRFNPIVAVVAIFRSQIDEIIMMMIAIIISWNVFLFLFWHYKNDYIARKTVTTTTTKLHCQVQINWATSVQPTNQPTQKPTFFQFQ